LESEGKHLLKNPNSSLIFETMPSAADIRRAQNAEREARKRKKAEAKKAKRAHIAKIKAEELKNGTKRIDKVAVGENVWTFWHRKMQIGLHAHTTGYMLHQYQELKDRQERSVVQLVGDWQGKKATERGCELRSATDLRALRGDSKARMRKAVMHEMKRRQYLKLEHNLTKGLHKQHLGMMDDAATIVQSYRRMVLAVRAYAKMGYEYLINKAARKIQALYRWRYVMRLALRRVRIARHLRILIPTFKIQRTYRLNKAMRVGLEEQRAVAKMNKQEQDAFWGKKRKDAELKISREYRENKAKIAESFQREAKNGVAAGAHKFGAVTNAAALILQRLIKARRLRINISHLVEKRAEWEALEAEAEALAVVLNPLVAKYVREKRTGEIAVASINYPPLKTMIKCYGDQHR
jgi:hypothetical protein